MKFRFLAVFLLVWQFVGFSQEANLLNWQEYSNYNLGFRIFFPEFTKIVEEDNSVRIVFPVSDKTDLLDRYILITVNDKENLIPPVVKGSREVSIDGISFKRTFWQEGAAGSIYSVLEFSSGNSYINIKCVLHQVNVGALDREVRVTDPDKEMAFLQKIVNTFQILSSRDTVSKIARDFLESQPLSLPVLRSQTVYKNSKEALVYAIRVDGTEYRVRLTSDDKGKTWRIKTASQLGEDVIEHNVKR